MFFSSQLQFCVGDPRFFTQEQAFPASWIESLASTDPYCPTLDLGSFRSSQLGAVVGSLATQVKTSSKAKL